MKLLFALLLILSTAECATSPRGRKQLIILPDSQMDAMGAQAFTDLKTQTPASTNPAQTTYVQCVTQPLLAQLEGPLAQTQWEVVVFNDDKTVNAFALPGGKIGVYTGLLKVAETPAQLAAVIGHEIGHVIARHGNERTSEALATQGGMAALGAILSEKTGSSYALVMGAIGVGAQYGVLLPHSRTQESEADLIGLELMAKAGFDPAQSVQLWKNMSTAGGGQPPEFLSTHPSNETRIRDLQNMLPEVEPLYKAASAHPSCTRSSKGRGG